MSSYAALDALLRASRAEAGLSGDWLFGANPRGSRAGQPATTRQAGQGRAGSEQLLKLAPRELALYQAAASLVKDRGQVAQLSSQTPLGSTAVRIGRDMRRYASQSPHPAMCTGALELTEHLQRQFATLRRPLAALQSTVQSGIELANEHFHRIQKRLQQDQASSTPPAAIATAHQEVAHDPAATKTLEQVVMELARLAIQPDAWAAVEAESTALQALREVHDAQSRGRESAHSTSVRVALDEALVVAEAAAYLNHAGRLHAQVSDGLLGGVASINEAHARHCTCIELAPPNGTQ